MRIASLNPSIDWAFSYQPRTADQKEAARLFHSCDLLFLLGVAGVGKTHCALGLALQAVREKEKKKVIFVRPLVEAGERVGFLPGELNEKIEPYLGPLRDITGKMSFRLPPGILEVKTLAYMRGSTFEDAVVILDEAQNSSFQQIKMLLTRMGRGSKVLVVGDPEQSDLPSQGDDLLDIVERLKDIDGVGILDFDSSVTLRHPLVARILKAL